MSDRSVVVETGPGGFNSPFTTIYWENGWTTTRWSNFPHFYEYFEWDSQSVDKLEEALGRIDQKSLRESPCTAVTLDAPPRIYFVLKSQKIIDLSPSEWDCYQNDPAVEAVNQAYDSP